MMELIEERGEKLDQQVFAISHADDEATALEVKEMIVEKFHPQDVFISSIGASVGSHTGAGTIAIFFLNKVSE
ncbi:DegV family protein, partial [Raoultella planticola]|uniref:DegV family protein n=2 Tax=Bacteria TaxID=2 RepID=UPI001953452C